MGDHISSILIMAVLLIMSAYFSATETAFSSLNKTRMKSLAEKGNRRAALALALADQYDRLLSTILVGNNIVNISLSSIGTVLFVSIYGDVGATISTIVITVLVLIFGEISPKSVAKDCPEKFAMFSAPIIRFVGWILAPVNLLFSLWKKLLSKILRLSEAPKMSQEELIMLVDEVEQDGSIGQDEGDLLRNAIEFTDRRAEEILTHRVELEGVSLDATKEDIADCFSSTKYSRLLVYDGDIDHIVGILNQKDFYTADGITERAVKDIMTEPLFVQQTVKISDLLKVLQTKKSHIAVVLDEFGGTLGIVTMEDILEELVGDIWDEHDEVIEKFKQLDENTYIVNCTATPAEFFDYFELKTESDNLSLSGWITEHLDKIAEVGDSFDFENMTVTVTDTDEHRVSEIRVELHEPEEPEEKPDGKFELKFDFKSDDHEEKSDKSDRSEKEKSE